MIVYILIKTSYLINNKNETFTTKVLHLSSNIDIILKKQELARIQELNYFKTQDQTPTLYTYHNCVMNMENPASTIIEFTTEKEVITLHITEINIEKNTDKKTEYTIGDFVALNQNTASEFNNITGIAVTPEIMVVKDLPKNKDLVQIYIVTTQTTKTEKLNYLASYHTIPKIMIHKVNFHD